VAYRRSYRQSRPQQKAVPLWRLMLVIIVTFWMLAALVYAVSQWIVPGFYSATPSRTPSGINYGTAFGTPFIKTWGLWMAVGLLFLGPFAAGWQALMRGGDALMGKALGRGR
jgi:hypothetical protein